MKTRKIKVTIKNKHLNALEDLLWCDLTPERKEKCIERSKKLWHELVWAYDEDKPYMKGFDKKKARKRFNKV